MGPYVKDTEKFDLILGGLSEEEKDAMKMLYWTV